MKRREDSERSVVRALEARFRAGAERAATVGIGDDAAVLRAVTGSLIWTVDTSVEGVHFDLRWLSLSDVGARSFHAAVSDLAAMGARPVAALSSLIVPKRLGAKELRVLTEAQAEAARELRCPVIGGNLSRGTELSVTTTVVGSATKPLTRAGARPGDELWLVGDVGLAAAGLAWLSGTTGRPEPRERAVRSALRVCVDAWRRPRARVREGVRLPGRARSLIDVSDGLEGDTGHIAEASSVHVVLDAALLARALRPELIVVAEYLGKEALSLALAGGEDYALVATGPAKMRPRAARRIGFVEKGAGVSLQAPDGRRVPAGSGYDHFSGRI